MGGVHLVLLNVSMDGLRPSLRTWLQEERGGRKSLGPGGPVGCRTVRGASERRAAIRRSVAATAKIARHIAAMGADVAGVHAGQGDITIAMPIDGRSKKTISITSNTIARRLATG